MEKQIVQIVMLGAGAGKRMKNILPKVLIPVGDKPMIQRLVDVSIASGLTAKPVVVVSEHNQDQVKDVLQDTCFYTVQKEQLGTGHAVLSAKQLLENSSEYVLVMYGDHPFVSPDTLQKLSSLVVGTDNVFSMATTKVEDFNDWRAPLADFGRIVRDEQKNILEIVEKKDATEEQFAIKELNPAYFCFNAKWLWQTLPTINNTNNQAEYYLTDLVKMAIRERKQVADFLIHPKEAMGVNSLEQLLFAETIKDSSVLVS